MNFGIFHILGHAKYFSNRNFGMVFQVSSFVKHWCFFKKCHCIWCFQYSDLQKFLLGEFETTFHRDKTPFCLTERAFWKNKSAFCYCLIFKLFYWNAKLLCRRLGFEFSKGVWAFSNSLWGIYFVILPRKYLGAVWNTND